MFNKTTQCKEHMFHMNYCWRVPQSNYMLDLVAMKVRAHCKWGPLPTRPQISTKLMCCCCESFSPVRGVAGDKTFRDLFSALAGMLHAKLINSWLVLLVKWNYAFRLIIARATPEVTFLIFLELTTMNDNVNHEVMSLVRAISF